MNPNSPYRYRRHLTLASILTLAGLGLALLNAWRPTPYTMMGFLGGSSLLILTAIGIFAFTQIRDFKARLDSVVTKRFTKGEIVYRQGDEADRIYFIKTGEVEVVRTDSVKGEVILGKLGPEDHFGETGIYRHGPRQATVRALSDMEVLTIHVTNLQVLYAHFPRLQERLHKEYERRKLVVEQALQNTSVG